MTNKKLAIYKNNRTFNMYFNLFSNIAINRFKFINLPPTVDPRYLSYTIYNQGKVCYFVDDLLGDLCMQVVTGGKFTVYDVPVERHVYAANGYNRNLDYTNSVLIYDNYMRNPTIYTVIEYCERITEIQRAIDTNVYQMKKPKIITCEESQKLTVENLFKEVEDNQPLILGNTNLAFKDINTLDISSPVVFPQLQIQKMYMINELLTILGVENANESKRERLITDEVSAGMGMVEAQRFVSLNNLRQNFDEVNRMFGRDIHVEYNTEMSQILTPEMLSTFDEKLRRLYPEANDSSKDEESEE